MLLLQNQNHLQGNSKFYLGGDGGGGEMLEEYSVGK